MPQIVFESGIHTLGSSSYSNQKKFWGGDLSSMEWNRAVSQRLRKYSPGMIAIDSTGPSFWAGRTDYNIDQKLWYLHMLPDVPSKLNGTDHITLMAGDFTDNLPNPNGPRQVLIRKLAAISVFGVASGSARGLIHAAEVYKEKRNQYAPVPKAPTINVAAMERRKFLGTMGGVGLAVLASGTLSSVALPFVPYRKAQQFSLQWADKVEEVVGDMKSHFDGGDRHAVDGRTALVIAKSYHASRVHSGYRRGQPMGVLMGSAHEIHALDYLRSKKSRIGAVARLATLVADREPETIQGVDIDRGERIKNLFDWLRVYELVRIEEPDKSAFKHDPLAEADRCVTHIGSTVCPEVDEALHMLPTRYQEFVPAT